MSRSSCDSLEKQLKANPDDVGLRQKLIECYGEVAIRTYSHSPSESNKIAKKHAGHMLWMIQHVPEWPLTNLPTVFLPFWSSKDHARIKNAWMEHLQARGSDVQILLNAASFFVWPGLSEKPDHDRAEELLVKAHGAAPGNPTVCMRLAEVLELKMIGASPEQKKQLARKALQLREQTSEDALTEGKYHQLKGLAQDAFDSDDEVKAQMYAMQLLELSRDDQEWSPDMSYHAANVILGRIALKKGNLEEAKIRLLEAGKPYPTKIPILPTFGPEMTLAKELLEKQEKDIVLQYFDACETFWPEKTKLNQWREIVRGGGVPDFRRSE